MKIPSPALFRTVVAIFFGTVPLLADAASGLTVEKDIPYLGPERAEKMDAYFPPDSFPRPTPAVLLIHGGAWRKGDKADKREQVAGQALAEAGYAVFSINYLLAGAPGGPESKSEIKLPWPQNFYDCKSALRYLKKEASSLKIDAGKVAVMGESAGGHLALLVGTTSQNAELNKGGLYTEQDNSVRCIIDFYGVPDVRKFGRQYFQGDNPAEATKNLESASPVSHLGKDTPPVLILHGDKDAVVSVDISRDFAAQLEKTGIEHQYVEIPGAPHAFHIQTAEFDMRPVVLEFLKKHMEKP